MNDKDLPTTTGPHGSAAAITPPVGTDAPGTPRPRRHRRPTRTGRAGENGMPAEVATDAKTSEENTANVVAEPSVSAENASTPTETNRPARRRGRTRKAAPLEETEEAAPETAGAHLTTDLPTAETGPAHETPNTITTPTLLAPVPTPIALPPATAPAATAPPAPTQAAPATPAPAPATTEATAEEAPKHRYRFDRRTVSTTFPNAPTTPAPAPGPLRRPGPLSSQWARPVAPPPVEEEEAAPAPVTAPPPVAPPPVSFAPPVRPAPVAPPPATAAPATPPPTTAAPEPEEIVLPRVVPPTRAARPIHTIQPEAEPEEIQIDEGEDTFTVTPLANSDDLANVADATSDRRGRRRRRGGRNGNGLAQESDERPAPVAASAAPTLAPPRYQQPPVATPPATVSQVAPEVPASPYGSPEPASARGFGSTPRGVASEYRGQSSFSHGRFARASSEGGPPISANHLANIIMEGIQQQTDRLLSEQRRHGQASSFTIAMPSTERVGVFVDVANLLYSSRSMRLPIDFGRLLSFLRADRRLVRAHAYCPTSPEPYADQQFLQAVKGLGYRITTKDYKTFSSGAKKADLDLDLCMDIVRIVDAQAVDTVVLVSGDSDFLPLLDYCSDHGVRVEVAAFDESTAAILRQSCDLFLNLSVVEEIRADR